MFHKNIFIALAVLVQMPALAANPFLKGFYTTVVNCQSGQDQAYFQMSMENDIFNYAKAVKTGTNFSTDKALVSGFQGKGRLATFDNVTFRYDAATKLHSVTVHSSLVGDIQHVQLSGSSWETRAPAFAFSPAKTTPIQCEVFEIK